MKQTLDISTSSIIRVFIVLIVIGFVFAIWQILAGIFLAIVIAAAMEPIISGISSAKIPRAISAFIVYFAALGVIAAVFYVVFPTLISETRQLSADLPEGYSAIILNIERFFERASIEINIQEQVSGFFGGVQNSISSGASSIFVSLFSLFGNILSFVLVLVISFYLSLQKDGIKNLLKSIVPAGHQEYALDLWGRVQKRLGRWFQSQLILALFTGVGVFVALWLMGAKYALTIAFVAGVLEIIPVIGPIIAGLIMFVLISFQSPVLGGVAIAVYFLIEQIQQHIFMPNVLSRTIGLNPVILIVALLVAAKLIGFWGVILAIPIAVTISEFVKDFRK